MTKNRKENNISENIFLQCCDRQQLTLLCCRLHLAPSNITPPVKTFWKKVILCKGHNAPKTEQTMNSMQCSAREVKQLFKQTSGGDFMADNELEISNCYPVHIHQTGKLQSKRSKRHFQIEFSLY